MLVRRCSNRLPVFSDVLLADLGRAVRVHTAVGVGVFRTPIIDD